MVDLLIHFVGITIFVLCLLWELFNDISKIRRSGGFDGYKGFIVAGIFIAAFVYFVPPTHIWRDTVALDDLNVATVTLDSKVPYSRYRSGFVGSEFTDSFFILNGTKEYWDFSPCGSGGSIIASCEDKSITIWYKKRVVYQVEADGEIIFSIENSNQRIILSNLTRFITYIFFVLLLFLLAMPKSRKNERKQILKRFCNNCGAELGKILEIRNRIEYEQYKFCAKCGLDSDPAMPTKRWDRHGKRFALTSAAILLITTVISAIAIVNDNVLFALIILAIVIIVFGVVFLMIKFCPHCGRMYEKENFCPNCGRPLNGH